MASRAPQAGVATTEATAEPSAMRVVGDLILVRIGSVDFMFGHSAMCCNMAPFAATLTAIITSYPEHFVAIVTDLLKLRS